jgi:DNA-directed RNA polymerase subunit RPC12/RpoP
MSGIIFEDKHYENSDLVCKYCSSPVWEIEARGNFCLTCNKILNDSDTKTQNQFYFPRVGIAYLNHDNKYQYLKDKKGEIIIFENQMSAESSLIVCKMKPEDFYYIEEDYLINNQGQ